MTTVEPTNLRPLTATLVARYAERFNAAFADGEHAVTSPLGAWLLLALVAPSADGDARLRLEDVLGTTADDAFARATVLLETPHPAVGLASGVWARREFLTTAYDRFAASLPEPVARGGVPTQAELDAWARTHSLGLIEHFPLEITDDTAIVLADALATDVRWDEPFQVVPSARSFRAPWAESVSRVLSAPRTHEMFIAETESAGHVAVHCARSSNGLAVVSVIADPSVAASSVHVAAHDVADIVLHRPRVARRRSLFDLPLGEGHAWTIRQFDAPDPPATEVVDAVLPAWEAASRHELMNVPAVGMCDGVAALVDMVSPEWPNRGGTAVQAARARYAARGFQAAALTTMLARTAGERDSGPATEPVRHALLRFDRPYAVVAVALADGSASSLPREAFPWHGIPVFSAWVAEPTDAAD